LIAYGIDQKEDVKGTPTQYKHAKYYSNGQGDFTLLLQAALLSFTFTAVDLIIED
jgi:hypothetical protein